MITSNQRLEPFLDFWEEGLRPDLIEDRATEETAGEFAGATVSVDRGRTG